MAEAAAALSLRDAAKTKKYMSFGTFFLSEVSPGFQGWFSS